jgi:hypothetical protein
LKPYVRDADKALVLMGHFKVHLTSDFVQSVNDLGVDVDDIPAGYTCVLQPVDVGVNTTFKKAIRDFHHQWCLDTYPKITNKVRLPTPERDNVYDWVVQSFDMITAKSIQKTFACIGLVDKDAYNDDDDDVEDEEPETADESEFFFQDLGAENEVDVDPAKLVEDFSALGI